MEKNQLCGYYLNQLSMLETRNSNKNNLVPCKCVNVCSVCKFVTLRHTRNTRISGPQIYENLQRKENLIFV